MLLKTARRFPLDSSEVHTNNHPNHIGRHLEAAQVAIALTQSTVSETKSSMITLEKQTNHIKDALVRVTGEAEFARGLKAGSEGLAG